MYFEYEKNTKKLLHLALRFIWHMFYVCRHANEKLGNKIREQSKAIMQLTAEKE